MDGPLSLEPYELGIAAGKSQAELEQSDDTAGTALELFRLGLIDATLLQVPGGEDWQQLEARLKSWWRDEAPTALPGRLVIASSSTVTMLGNVIAGTWPSSGRYVNYPSPNGGVRWFGWNPEDGSATPDVPLARSTWPAVESSETRVRRGVVRFSRFGPAWEVRPVSAVIAPGYFGNSRAGPYGLYTRLARRLGQAGVETFTFDYLGTGESSPATRTFATDLSSLMAVLSLTTSARSAVIGHSAGSALAVAASSQRGGTSAICLAPLCEWSQLSLGLLDSQGIAGLERDGYVDRRGIRMYGDYVLRAEQVWLAQDGEVTDVVFGGSDGYAPEGSCSTPGKAALHRVDDAEHNFAAGNSTMQLLDLIEELVTL